MKAIINQIRKSYQLVSKGNTETAVEEFLKGGTAYEKAASLKALETFIKEAKTKLSEQVLKELDEENNREFEGFKIYKTTTPTKYSFDHNEDWSRHQAQLDKIKKQQKEIEDNMKLAFNKGITILDDQTGEVYEPAKYKSGGKETFAVK
jgi:uncharacterized protein YdaT